MRAVRIIVSVPLIVFGAIFLFYFGIGLVRGTAAGSSGGPAAAGSGVTYACTGDGIANITYGPEGSSFGGSQNLPFTGSTAYSTTALYFDTHAQLQGGGDVTCTTTVNTGSQTITQTAQASGGYNIASAQICRTGDGLQAC